MPLLKSGAKHRRGTGLLAKASEGALDAELADLYSQQLCVSPLSECAESQADGSAASESLARLRTHQIDRWRSALLGTIAASSLFVYGGRPARADCSGASTTLTCTGTIAGTVPPGVVNGGIDVPTGYTTLNVNHLDADITPASGVDGILVVSTGDVAIVSNTTDGTVAHAISVTGVGADGITARSSAGAVTVDSTGDITSTNGRGVAAYSRGIAADVSIASVGAISAMSDGINAFSYTRAVTVHSTGDITSTNGQGISAANHEDGSVLVTSVGAINAYSDGIYARSWSALSTGAITVKSTGDITSAIGRGIVAFSDGASDISVTTTGNVNAAYEGVSAISSAGSATVNSAGDITSTNGVGIIAANFAYGAGDISITSKGDIRTNFEGINAFSYSGAVTVNNTGDITSTNGRGVAAYSEGTAADISITSVGAINAYSDGIYARSWGALSTGAITVKSTGDITSAIGRGIVATNVGATDVSVTSAGNINAYSDGIYARSTNGAATVDSTGDITSAKGQGIYARSFGAGDVSVTSVGSLETASAGIRASSSTGAVTVDSTGDITSTNGQGIVAANFAAGAGDITVTSIGAINAKSDGIYALSYNGAVTVDSTGDITSATGRGIYARNLISGAGNVSITSAGVINAYSDGVYARTQTSAIAIDSTGDITSTNGHGIVATNVGATDVSVTSAGNINAYSDGIYARSTNGAATVDSTGDITSAKGQGIYARSFGAGDVSVTSVGSLETASAGIRASSSTGAVTVDSTGDITSTNGQGIVAANFAAGAGDVSVTSVGAINAYSDGIYALSYNGAVTVDSTGDITSATGRGIYANNVTNGNVSVTSKGAISAKSDGILALSTTGAVAVDSTGDITSTIGYGIGAQSFGAGNVSVTSAGDINASFGGIAAISATGAVTIHNTGDITSTNGPGIAAMNNGAGDISVTSAGGINAKTYGIVGVSTTGAVTIHSIGDIASTYMQGIFAFNYGAGNVSVTSAGAINANSDGISAHSYTGAVAVHSIGDITSTTGRGIYARNFVPGAGDISVTSVGAINAKSDGIFASSMGGGNVSVTSTGDIVADGIGINAGSSGPTTNGNVSVTVLGGEVTGAVAAIEISDGAVNSVLNRGTLKSSSGTALIGGSGSETIDNYGTVIGNIDLGSGANAFNNHMGGAFRSGASVNLATGNVLTNAGTLSPFGPGIVGTTDVTGSFVQTASGTFAVDVDLAGHAADRLNASGTASLAGSVVVNLASLPSASSQQFTILSSSETTHTDLALLASPVLHATLSYPDAQDVVLGISVDFTSPGLTPNEKAVGDYLDAAFAGGSGGLSPVLLALLNTPGVDGYKAALDRLSPEHYLAQVEDTVQANLLFIDSMISCPNANGRPNYIYEGQCYWAKVSGRSYDWDRTQSNIGGDTEGWTVSGGVQAALTETMRLGFAGSYEHTNISTSNAASSEGDRGEGGVVLKDRWGNTSFAVAAFGGYGSFETKRYIGLDGIGTAEGNQGISFGGAHARISHLLDQGGWYLKPMVDFDAIYVDYGDLNEHGGGAANLAVHGNNDWVLSTRPAIEIGSEFKASDGSFVRPYVRLGGLFFDDNNFALTSDFVAAPSGISPFTITSSFDQSYFSVGAGMDVLTLSGIDLKLNYEGLFAGHSDANSGGLKVSVKF